MFLTYLLSDGYQYTHTHTNKDPHKNESTMELAAQESALILAEWVTSIVDYRFK